MDAAEILSLAIIAKLAAARHLSRELAGLDGSNEQSLFWLFTDIAKAIRKAMPDADMTELERWNRAS